MTKNVELKNIFKYKFVDSDSNTETVEVTDCINNTGAYDKARKIIKNKYNLSIQEFESSWSVKNKKHIIGFKNKPWRSINELESDLLNINGIKNISNVSKLRINDPLTYYIRIDTNCTIKNVKNRIKNYFYGLTVDEKSNCLFVSVDPMEFNN